MMKDTTILKMASSSRCFCILLALSSFHSGGITTRRKNRRVVGCGDGDSCRNNPGGIGLAMAFSPSSYIMRGFVRYHHGHNFVRSQEGRRHLSIDASDSSDVNGDIIEDAEQQQYTSIYDYYNDTKVAKTISKKSTAEDEFDAIVNARYACTRFQRYQEPHENNNNITHGISTPIASLSDQSIVQRAHQCMALSQRAPTGFNAQPYRVILVHSKDGKENLARYCLGRNADRVRDSDCTAVFLADKECGRDGRRFVDFLVENMDPPDLSSSSSSSVAATSNDKAKTSRTRRALSPRALLKLRMLILLFSSGYPLPRFLSVPLSLGIRMGISIFSFFMRCLHSMKQSSVRLLSSLIPYNVQLLPTLASAETWSQKNTMLVAMTYMLACTSRGLATCPMEGFDASGVRKVLGIPRGRYSIPLIVSTGSPHQKVGVNEEEETDDVGLSHGSSNMSPRFPLDEVVFGNAFGKPFSVGAVGSVVEAYGVKIT